MDGDSSTVSAITPTALIRPSAEVEGPAGGRTGAEAEPQVDPVAGFGGWNSMTMALMA
jgi:hypothetical protein